MRGDDRGQLGKAHLGEGRHIETVATSTGGVAECEVLMKIVVIDYVGEAEEPT